MKYFIVIFWISSVINITETNLYSQVDSSEVTSNTKIYQFNRGIYRNINEFKANSPSFGISDELMDIFIYEEIDPNNIYTFKDVLGIDIVLKAHEIWGVSNGKSIYVYFKPYFYKIQALNSISYLFYYKNKNSLNIYGTSYNSNNPNNKTSYLKAILDVETGNIFKIGSKSKIINEGDISKIKNIIKRDIIVYNEFLNDKKEEKYKIFKYIIMYNEKNKINFINDSE